jgi:iron(III) transport system substrate-binding protein
MLSTTGPLGGPARRTALLATGALLTASALAACGTSDGDDAPAGGAASEAAAPAGDQVLTIYSGRTENLIQPLLDQFAEEAGVEVDVRYFDSADLALLIEQEGDRSPADVFISQSPGALGYLNDLDVLTELEPEVLDLVGEEFRAADGSWVGMSGRVRTLVYNSELVEESDLPASVFDLTDPAYAGLVGLAPTNGSFQDFVTALRESEGDEAAQEWLEGMAANDAQAYSNNTAIVQAVAAGEVPFGLVNHYYNYRALAEDPSLPTVNHFFEAGDIGNLNIVTGVAVVETTDDPELANDFVEFVLGEQAQTFFSEETFEYPLVEGVEPGTDLPPISDLGIASFDVDSLGGGLERTQELISDSGLEG